MGRVSPRLVGGDRRAIVVIEARDSKVGPSVPRRPSVCRMPRATRLGPVSPKGYIWIDGKPHQVGRDRETIATIDREVGFPPDGADGAEYGAFWRPEGCG